MFKSAGNFDCTIVDAFVSECKFPAKENEANNRNELVATYYDVVLMLQDANGNTDMWHGEISTRTGTGTRAHMYRYELTLETLRQIGFNVNTLSDLQAQFSTNQDRTVSLPNLVNLQCTAVVEASEKLGKNGTPFFNIKYIIALGAATGGAKKLTVDELMQKIGATPATAAPPLPSSTPAPAAAPAPAPAAPAAPNWNPPTMQNTAGSVPPPPAAPAAPTTPKCPY